MSRVLFIQRMIPDYRLPFFVCLQKKLKMAGIEFYVSTGESLPEDCLNDARKDYPWIIQHKNHYIYRHIHIHRVNHVDTYDLVIVMQENAHLINYVLLLRRYLRGKPLVAFYGHGKNVNIQGRKIREVFKRKISCLPDWWFAYTALTERILINNGYPEDKITVANNAIDNTGLKTVLAGQTPEKQSQLRAEMGISEDSKVAIYCGRLIDIKVSFLLKALERIRQNNDGFEVIIVGAGPLEEQIRECSERYRWMHYVGSVYGSDRGKYFCISDVFLMPGMVGLAILDAFTYGLPIVTTDCGVHSPEIEYLERGLNGYITPNQVEPFADKVCELLRDDEQLSRAQMNARESAEKYSIEKMAENFSVGIDQVLERD